MYSRQENQKLRQEFWIAFAENYPRKWMLYDTKIKDFSFKFYADNKQAEVMISLEMRDPDKRHAYFDKLVSLKVILEEDYIADLLFEKQYYLEDGKVISKVWAALKNVNIGKRDCWPAIFGFFNEKMSAFELFFGEFDDYIKDI